MKKIIILSTLIVFIFSINHAICQTPEYKMTVKKMLKVTGSEETFKVVIEQMISQMKSYKQIPSDVWDEIEKEFMKTSLNDLIDLLAPIYNKHLSESDLQTVIKFYESPAGKKFAKKTPIITQESMQVGQQWGMQIGAKLAKKLEEKGY